MCVIKKVKDLFKNKYFLDFSYIAVGFAFSSLFSIYVISLINKNLEPEQLGRFSYYKSLFELIVMFLSFDFFSAYLRFNCNGVNKRFYKFSRFYSIFLCLVLSCVFFLITDSIYASLFSFIIFFNERSYFYRSILNTFRLNLLKIVPSILTLLVLFYFIKNESLNYEFSLLSYGLGYLFCLFFFFKKDEIDYSDLVIKNRDVLRYCIPGGILSIVSWLLGFSAQMIIKHYYGFSELAGFAVSQRALLSIKLFSGLFITFFPAFYYRELEKQNFRLIRKVRNLMTFSLVLIVLVLCLFAKYIYILLGSSLYLDTLNYFRIQLVSEFFFIITNFYAMFFSYRLETVKSLIVYSIGAIVNVALLLIFLDKVGIVFACYSSLISSILIFILVYFYSYRRECKYSLG